MLRRSGWPGIEGGMMRILGVRRRAGVRGGVGAAIALALVLGPVAAGNVLAATAANDDHYVVDEDGTLMVDVPGVLANDTQDAGAPCVTGVDVDGLFGFVGDKD